MHRSWNKAYENCRKYERGPAADVSDNILGNKFTCANVRKNGACLTRIYIQKRKAHEGVGLKKNRKRNDAYGVVV